MYIPKFKQSKARYTDGTKYYVAETNTSYQGYYIETSKGEYFTGTTYRRGVSKLLLPVVSDIPGESGVTAPFPLEYDNVKQDPTSYNLRETAILPVYTPKAIEGKQYIFRYFAQKKADNIIQEISLETYTELQAQSTKYHYPGYRIVRVIWHTYIPVDDLQNSSYIIKGSRTKNAEEVAKAEKVLPGISTYLVDLTELIS